MAYTTIDKPTDYFNTKLYTGDGNSSHAITGVGFQPDWTWNKNRSITQNHALTDSVRGAPLRLMSQSSEAEINQTTGLLSFNSDGFTVGADAGYNGSGNSIVSWNWKAGTSFTNDASATGIGTIDSAGSFNNDAGFSIVSYTGNSPTATTIKHGLNSVPQMIIFKRRVGVGNWSTYHQSLGNTKALSLNTTATPDTDAGYFNNTTPTSSVFSVANSGDTNSNGNAMIAYCFAEKQGYSKFGSYTGNSGNNADAPFIYTGFKPAFFLVKNTSQASAWEMYDSKRLGYNDKNYQLRANENQAESATSDYVDFLSNGFKIRHQGSGINENGHIFLYMAFAEQPFVTSTGVPATAR